MSAPADPVRERMAVIVNTATKGNVARIIHALREAAPDTVDLDIRPTEYAGHAGDLALSLREKVPVIVAVGGDGTVGEVAGAIRGTGTRLAIMPGGSTNIVARELGIPVQPERAVALLFGPHAVRPLDVGLCGDRAFLHMAGAGFDSAFFDRTSVALKRRIGWAAYLPAAAAALRTSPARYRIVTADSELDVVSPLVLIANGGSIIHPRFRLNARIRKDDGLLDVLVVTATTPVALAGVLARLATLHLTRSPDVIHLTTTEVSIASERPVPIELDGDVVTATPARFTIDPGGIRVLCPPLPSSGHRSGGSV